MGEEVAVEQLEQNALAVPSQAEALVINDNLSLGLAGEILTSIKAMKRKMGESFDPIIKTAHQAHKEAVAQKKKLEKPLNDAEKIIKAKVAEYSAGQERIRKAEEDKLRIEAEKAEEEKRLKEAEKLEADGETAKADAVIDAPTEVKAVVVKKTIAKVEGVSIKTLWKFNVVNESEVPREYLMVDEKKVRDAVTSQKEACSIPGIHVYSEGSVAVK